MLRRIAKLVMVVLALAGFAALPSCASRVWMMVPARVDLAGYQRIGVVQFEGGDTELRRRATGEFEHWLLQARPGLQVIEMESLDARQDLDAVFVGSIEFSKLSPTVGIASSLIEVQARAELVGTLSVRLIEPGSGATVWMDSCGRSATVASAGIDTSGSGSVGYTDIEGMKFSMVSSMAEEVTDDFRDQFYLKRQEEIPPHYQVTYSDGVAVYVPPEAGQP